MTTSVHTFIAGDRSSWTLAQHNSRPVSKLVQRRYSLLFFLDFNGVCCGPSFPSISLMCICHSLSLLLQIFFVPPHILRAHVPLQNSAVATSSNDHTNQSQSIHQLIRAVTLCDPTGQAIPAGRRMPRYNITHRWIRFERLTLAQLLYASPSIAFAEPS
jgi:hypothetical protein